jgi:potassium efflux system protein
MRSLFTVLIYSLLTQLSVTYGQAPIKLNEITKKIESFSKLGTETETDTAQKEKWERLLKLRKETNLFLAETQSLTESNRELSSQEANLLKPINLTDVSKDIPTPSLTQISDRVSEIEQLRENIEIQQDTLNNELTSAEASQKLIPDEINKVQTDLAVVKALPDPTDEISILIRREQIAMLESHLKKLKLAQLNLEKGIPIKESNLKIVAKDKEKILALYEFWNGKLIDANKDTAATIKEKTDILNAKLSVGSAAKELTEQTISLSKSLLSKENIHTELRDIRKELTNLKRTQYLIDEQQDYAEERIELLEKAAISIDQDTGTLLRKQRSELPTEKELKLSLQFYNRNSTRNQLALLKEREDLESISTFTPDAYEIILTEKQQSELTKEEFTSLITSTKLLHKIVIDKRVDLAKEYRELTFLLQKTIKSSKKYSLFIDTRLLWIVSHPTIGKQSFIDEAKSLNILYGPASLTELLTSWKADLYESPIIWVLFFVLIIGIFLLRKKLYHWAENAHKASARGSCNTFTPTLIGLLYVMILVLPIPLILAFLGWRTPTALPLQAGLYMGSMVCLSLGLMRRMCKPSGFFESNNMVSIGHLKLFRKVIQSLFIILPLVAITATSLTKINSEFTQGRLFNMLLLIIMAVAMNYLLLPKKRVISGKNKPGFLSYLAYITFVIFPLALVVVAASGYFISMLTLKIQLTDTIRVILLILFVSALLKRWLLVTRRRALMSAHQTAITDDESALTEQEKKQEIQETVSKVSEQSAKLIRIAATVVLVFSLLSIWAKTLPALFVLDDIELWKTSSSEVSGKTNTGTSLLPMAAMTGSSDKPSGVSQSNTRSISLQDLLVTITVSFLTYLAAVNIPSLLQITIFNHLNLKHGTAFTVTTSIRYIIIIVGIIWAFGSIGVTWDKIQWLAAAITLGIGFGLQEIFANFVAGLILLFERPIRIGDLITVGEINGKVSKIQMRATTILQFNNRELIVPNKEFITGQLVNWTLSDNVIRADIPVGIAYGSDTVLARDLLLQCAEQNKRALDTPEPDAIFSAFGSSSLDFILRVHISSVDDLMPVQSELHFAIDQAYREAGIEIAFPQQDIHIRSIDAAFPTENKAPVTD